jgi:hypothetical protein
MSGCFSDVNALPQASLMTARLLNHVERNDSFASGRCSISRQRMLSGGTLSLQDGQLGQDVQNRTKFYSESSDPGLMMGRMRSPSMRKPTNAGIVEERDDFDENVRN